MMRKFGHSRICPIFELVHREKENIGKRRAALAWPMATPCEDLPPKDTAVSLSDAVTCRREACTTVSVEGTAAQACDRSSLWVELERAHVCTAPRRNSIGRRCLPASRGKLDVTKNTRGSIGAAVGIQTSERGSLRWRIVRCQRPQQGAKSVSRNRN